jgi:hypothetical protein
MNLIGTANQSFEISAIKSFNTVVASTRWVKLQTAAHLFHDLFGLVIVEMSFVPQTHGLHDHFSEVGMRLRNCLMTTHFMLL